ncbi:MAG: hypothetical protein A2040_06850 [Rhodocyclales bacterium GWA2_65_19]|nr:MAG: hypothetical protein A2040_06850 [Rhodocyclales bacterium GWA2_65_19]
MIEDAELQRLFRAESEEHLARLDDSLLRLERAPADQALLEETFREAHSLKGAASMLGLHRVESTAHGLEGILNAARKGTVPLTPDTIERMNVALGALRQRVLEALGEASAATAADSGAVPPAPTVAPDAATASAAPDLAAPSAAFPASPAPPAAETAPTTEPVPMAAPAANAKAAAPPAAGEPFRIETVRVETRKLDDLLTQVGELSVIQGRTQHRRALLDELLDLWAALGRRRRIPNRPVRHGAGSVGDAAELRAAATTQRFGALLKQARDALVDDGMRLESTVGLLEDQVHGIRLLPLATVFSLFPRMARDLAKEQGKEVDVVLDGGDITVDKRILEEVKDPLMHLIRNAIDHGVEAPGERTRLGKASRATVRLCAVREDAGVMLEVRDDGRGLDPAAIRQEAGRRGLADEAALAAMTPFQLQQLIFTAGFSTSRYVTELSGRGVGLDVVRVNVERLKGSIRLESQPGRGLAVQLRLPLSLATTRLLLASVGDRRYGLPVECVLTSRRVRAEEIFTLEGRPAVMLDDEPVIVARLADLLELSAVAEKNARAAAAQAEVLACVVLQVGEDRMGRLGLLVDDLLDEEEVVPKPLGAPLKRVRNVAALTMLGSGEICAVLNPADLLRSAHKTAIVQRTADRESRQIRRDTARPAVLLAEDSALIRAMEKRILEDGGYEVVTAVDGVDAINILGNRAFAAVVSDIVMPNMDGLALTRRIRTEPRYKEMPVILVTTLASDDDKRRGLDAGANAYIPKPSFDQRVLLDTLKRLIAP